MDEEDAPEILCEPSFWYGVVGLEPFVIMNLECTTYMGEEIGVVTEGPRDCIFCRDCAAKVFLSPTQSIQYQPWADINVKNIRKQKMLTLAIF